MTNELTIRFEQSSNVFRPKAEVRGVCQWKCSENSKADSGALYLLWYTDGVGTQDIGIVASQEFKVNSRIGESRFSFTLPESPLSISTSIISVLWAVEAVIGKDSTRVPFVNSPWGKEIVMLYEDEHAEDFSEEDEESLDDNEFQG